MRTAIIGCGYLGLELGRQLADEGHDVVGVRRSETGLAAVREAGLEAVRADATDGDSLDAVPAVDAVVYAASAGRGGDRRKRYVSGLRTVVDHFAARASPPDHLVYTSSTGVYGDHSGDWVDEETSLDPETERERILVEAESVALEGPIPATVARLGGIYGPDRHRVERYLDRPVLDAYLNLIHVADGAGAIRHLLHGDGPDYDVVLLVDDEPVRKPDLSRWLAEQLDATPAPTRTRSDVEADDSLSTARKRRLLADKRCSNARLRERGYEFTYPTYREGFASAVEARREAPAGGGH